MRAQHVSLTLTLVFVLACGDDDTPDVDASTVDAGESGPTRLAAVRDIAGNVLLPTYEDFAGAAADLETATVAWADSGSETDLEAARNAWFEAMRIWQQAELMLVGPAGAMDLVAGGEDLRDAIYSWPIVNRCRVDQELVGGAYVDVDTFANENVNVLGLDALEALLFVEGDENGCAPNSSINTSGAWTEIVPELATRRAAYAATAATLVRRDADALVAVWDTDFMTVITTAGEGSELYASAQEALNGISDALFYLDKEAKDMKVAVPAGISIDCATDSCPDDRESLYANHSIPHVANNVRGFGLVFTGGDGMGFDDLLVEAGAESLSTEVLDAVDAAITLADAIEGDVPTILAADPAGLDALHAALKAITDLFKTQVVAVLDLELPMRAEGDND